MIRIGVLLIALCAVGMQGCSTTPVAAPSLPEARFSDSNDVILLPTDDFPFEFAANLAKLLASDANLKVRTVLNLGTKDWKPYPNAPQYDPAKLKDIALPAIRALKKEYGGSLYILLTTRDMNSSSGNLRFVFAESYPQDKVSVISAARMLTDADGQRSNLQVITDRLRKMVLRTTGLLYFELPRSANPQDLMYSPLMSLDALDAMAPRLKP